MSDLATAWARTVRCGSPARKLVLMSVASHSSPHEDEADGFHSCYPGQDLLMAECEMGERSLRDHLKELVAMGLIQRKKRYRYDGTRSSDWFRVPVRSSEILGGFPFPQDDETPAEWWPWRLPADIAGSEENARSDQPADSAGSEPAGSVSESTTGRSEHDYRQTVAGKKKDLRKGVTTPLRSNGSVGSSTAPVVEEEKISQPRKPSPHPVDAVVDEPTRVLPMTDDEVALAVAAQDREAVENRARMVVYALDWLDWGTPPNEYLKTLRGAIQRAFRFGWTAEALTHHCQRAIESAKSNVGAYLLNALTPKTEGGQLRVHVSAMRESMHTMSENRDWRMPPPDIDPDTRETKIEQVRQELKARGKHRAKSVRERVGG